MIDPLIDPLIRDPLIRDPLIWEGGTYPTNLTLEDGSPDPNAGTEWCFKYGEEEWMAGKKFAKVRQAAADYNSDGIKQTPVGRANCN